MEAHFERSMKACLIIGSLGSSSSVRPFWICSPVGSTWASMFYVEAFALPNSYFFRPLVKFSWETNLRKLPVNAELFEFVSATGGQVQRSRQIVCLQWWNTFIMFRIALEIGKHGEKVPPWKRSKSPTYAFAYLRRIAMKSNVGKTRLSLIRFFDLCHVMYFRFNSLAMITFSLQFIGIKNEQVTLHVQDDIWSNIRFSIASHVNGFNSPQILLF